MKIPWRSSTEKNDNNPHTILDGPKSEPIDTTAHYFLLDKGCPGDTKSLVKFDGAVLEMDSIRQKMVYRSNNNERRLV